MKIQQSGLSVSWTDNMAAKRDIQELTADFRNGQNGFTIHLPFVLNTTGQRTKSANQSESNIVSLHINENKLTTAMTN